MKVIAFLFIIGCASLLCADNFINRKITYAYFHNLKKSNWEKRTVVDNQSYSLGIYNYLVSVISGRPISEYSINEKSDKKIELVNDDQVPYISRNEIKKQLSRNDYFLSNIEIVGNDKFNNEVMKKALNSQGDIQVKGSVVIMFKKAGDNVMHSIIYGFGANDELLGFSEK